jgi:hypothetical protein
MKAIQHQSYLIKRENKTKTISSSAEYVTLRIYFSHPSLLILPIYLFFFPVPPIKLKLGWQIGGRLLMANHLDQSLWSPIRNTEEESDHIYSFLQVHNVAVLFTTHPPQTLQLCWAETIFLSQINISWLFFI